MAVVIVSVIVLGLIPLYLPAKGLAGTDLDDGMFYFILILIYLILFGYFVGEALFDLDYDTDLDLSTGSDIKNITSLQQQVG